MIRSNAIVLIDCENLTGSPRLEGLGRWAGFGRIELFGREGTMAPWRDAIRDRGLTIAAETLVADDAPSQDADQRIARRVDELIAQPVGGLVVIASNDKGFAADLARLAQAGLPARQDKDPTEAEILRLVVAEIAGEDGWAGAGGVGDHLRRRFRLDTRGRLEALARRAGLEIRKNTSGLWMKNSSLSCE
ncbi:MAG: hypothetical protein HY055_03860 [Magnetospirillum sp.]|nr:hypothetical protein [Magnetospirillum sp.]